jgi:hypothetical protein
MRLPFDTDGFKHASHGWILVILANQRISLKQWTESAVNSRIYRAHRRRVREEGPRLWYEYGAFKTDRAE